MRTRTELEAPKSLTPKQIADQEKRSLAKESWEALRPTWVLEGRKGTVSVRASSGHDYMLKGEVVSISTFGIVVVGNLKSEPQISNYFVPWNSICFFKEDPSDAE